MTSITEGKLTFTFPDGWKVLKYDDSSFHKNQFQKVCGGAQAVDFLAIDPSKHLWVIEVKDYREHPRSKPTELPIEIAGKVRDTLAAIVVGKVRAYDDEIKAFCADAIVCGNIRVVFHLEQPQQHSKLFPRAIDPANIELKLKQLLKTVDPHLRVTEISSKCPVGWNVTSVKGNLL